MLVITMMTQLQARNNRNRGVEGGGGRRGKSPNQFGSGSVADTNVNHLNPARADSKVM